MVSDSTEQLTILELTVPCKEQMVEAKERKCAKYQEPEEVGCQGFAGRVRG